MNKKAFFIILEELSIKHINKVFFLEGESPTLNQGLKKMRMEMLSPRS